MTPSSRESFRIGQRLSERILTRLWPGQRHLPAMADAIFHRLLGAVSTGAAKSTHLNNEGVRELCGSLSRLRNLPGLSAKRTERP
jgi:hypothetical protein